MSSSSPRLPEAPRASRFHASPQLPVSTPPTTPAGENRVRNAVSQELAANSSSPGSVHLSDVEPVCHADADIDPATAIDDPEDAGVPTGDVAPVPLRGKDAFFPGEAYFDIGREEMMKLGTRVIFHDWIQYQLQQKEISVPDRKGKLPPRLPCEKHPDPSGLPSIGLFGVPRIQKQSQRRRQKQHVDAQGELAATYGTSPSMGRQVFATPRGKMPRIVVSSLPPPESSPNYGFRSDDLPSMDRRPDEKKQEQSSALLPGPQITECREMSWDPAAGFSSSSQARGTPNALLQRRQNQHVVIHEVPLQDHVRAQRASLRAQIMSDRTYVECVRVRIDTARAMTDYSVALAHQAQGLFAEASRELEHGRVALEAHAGLIARLEDIPVATTNWSEMSIAEKVRWMGLETARTLSYGRCACTDPNCTLPEEVKQFMRSNGLK